MKSISVVLCGFVLAALPCTPALADTFSFNFAGPTVSGSGNFDATEISNGDTYLINNLSNGSVTGIGSGSLAITGLLGTGAFEGNDNLLIYPGKPGNNSPVYFTGNGVSFSLANGQNVNLLDLDGTEQIIWGTSQQNFSENVTMTVSDLDAPVPEPSSLALLGTGVLAAVGAFRRRLMA